MNNLPFGLTFQKLKIIIAIVGSLLFLYFLFIIGLKIIVRVPTMKLVVWGVIDDKRAFDSIVDVYSKANKNVTITYVPYVQKNNGRSEVENYENDLVNALAEGRGPDIFMVQNNWLPKHESKILPLDQRLQTATEFPFVKYRDLFPEVVMNDFTRDSAIYAFPLYLDSLAMFYNLDIFARKSIAVVPTTWSDFESVVSQIREIDTGTNNIKLSAAAIGGTTLSVNRATDLVSLIMMQRGAKFTNSKNTSAIFSQSTEKTNPGLEGLKFYTQFANPYSQFYTWSERFPYSIDSFASGNTAIMFNYAHAIPIVKAKNAFLKFRVAPVPQPADAVQPTNYANYWGLAVSRQSENPQWAWDFIAAITANEVSADAYSVETGKPPALLTLIDRKKNDPELGVFVRQSQTAKSWWQKDTGSIEGIISEMIGAVIRGELSAEVAIDRAEDAVSLLMR